MASIQDSAGPEVRAPASLAVVGSRVDARVRGLLDAELDRWRRIDPDLAAPLDALRDLVAAGGKRLRPAFCYWAFVGSGADPAAPVIVDAGAALELLHTFALVHDDVMDASDTRRGLPAVHRRFISQHVDDAWHGESRRYGEGAAVLVGDFAFVYSDRLVAGIGPEARAVYDELRVELCVGQYLDLVGTAGGTRDRERARRIERYKSGKYTVERPLHLGAALAGRYRDLAGSLTEIGIPLGEAFQLRDDLLGVFGDASVTGKPVGDDLREGKLTPLVAAAAERVLGADATLLGRLGAVDLTADEIASLQDLLDRCGAREEIERAIGGLVTQATRAIHASPLTTDARDALAELATFVAYRDR
ncbi:MAG: polyprenyl synthetase family protein [Acidimicrobiia bacterium]